MNISAVNSSATPMCEPIPFIVLKIYIHDSHDNVGDLKPRAIVSQLPVPNFE